MKNKIITVILGLLLVVSAVINVWQYNNNNSLKVQSELLQNELDSIEENINSLNMDISAKNEEITTLTSKIADLETEIATLTAENENLSAQIKELESAKSDLEKQFVSNKYLSDTKVEVTQPSPTTDNNSISETPAATPETTPSSGTTPNGTKLGRDNMPRRDLGGSEGGSGRYNDVELH